MNKVKLVIWNRSFELPVAFDCYDDEKILDAQYEALDKFCTNEMAIAEAKSDVERYCIQLNGKEIGTNIDNIFKYVMPSSLYIRRTDSTDRFVGLVCKYRFDPEDGLVVLFKNEALFEIGTSDIL